MKQGHGDDLYKYPGKIKANFSSNIRGVKSHEALMRHLAGCEAVLRQYPVPDLGDVDQLFASFLGLQTPEVMVTNGATEAIYLIASHWEHATSHIQQPTFSEYGDACTLHGHKISPTAGAGDTLRWRCNPNNPTGQVINKENLLEEIDANPDKIFIIDQSYAEYTLLPVLSNQDACRRPNVLLLGSFTKRFGAPGIRLGYVSGHSGLLQGLKQKRLPWSIGALQTEAARYLIRHAAYYPIEAETLHSEALRIGAELQRMGIHTEPTDCNFLLCQLCSGRAAELKQWLVEHHGILIRDASNFQGLSPRHFRVAAQSPEENDTLIKALKEWTKQCY